MRCPKCLSELEYIDDDRISTGWYGDCSCYSQFTESYIKRWNKEYEKQIRIDRLVGMMNDALFFPLVEADGRKTSFTIWYASENFVLVEKSGGIMKLSLEQAEVLML